VAEYTVRDFQVSGDIAAFADAWAQANHFGVSVDADGTRRYQRGQGFLTGIMFCTVRQTGPYIRVVAWIHATLVARICALFLIPTNMSVESGGVRGVLPRSMCRNAVNQLLVQLGQQPIP
jgi:hypothetical protein